MTSEMVGTFWRRQLLSVFRDLNSFDSYFWYSIAGIEKGSCFIVWSSKACQLQTGLEPRRNGKLFSLGRIGMPHFVFKIGSVLPSISDVFSMQREIN